MMVQIFPAVLLVALCQHVGASELELLYSAPPEAWERRLTGRQLTEVKDVTITVLRKDFFSHPGQVDVYFDSGDGSDTYVYFPGTDGNTGSKMPHGLVSGMTVTMVGAQETDAAKLAQKHKELQPPDGVAASIDADAAPPVADSRPIFVAANISASVANSGIANAADPNAGTAPAEVTALVILVKPCGSPLNLDKEASLFSLRPGSIAILEKAVFDKDNTLNQWVSTPGSGATSWAYMHWKCSRGKSQASGKVIGPIEVCPTQLKNIGATWRALKPILESEQKQTQYGYKYTDYTYKILIMPDDDMPMIGAGELGGTVSWIKASYSQKPSLYLHEIGHNMYLHHSGNADGSVEYAGGPRKGSNKFANEYADLSSAMGSCCSNRCYHFIHMWQLGWADVAQSVTPSQFPSSGIMDLEVKALSDARDSGVIFDHGQTHLVFSYRDSQGFDAMLGSSYQDQLYVHGYTGMSSKRMCRVTKLLATVTLGQTIMIPDSDYKVTWHAKIRPGKGKWTRLAKIRLCKSLGSANECGSDSSSPVLKPTSSPVLKPKVPVPVPAPPPSPPTWSSYFSEEQVGGEVTSLAMVGIGCKGNYCDQVKTAHSSVIRVDLKSAKSQTSTTDLEALSCDAGMVISRLRCHESHCGRIEIDCAPVLGGILIATAIPAFENWIPEMLHDTVDGTCPEGSVMTSIQCGGTRCWKKMITCHKFSRAACTGDGTCSALGMQCSVDGCGSSCGTCASGISTKYSQSCLPASGRCLSQNIQSDWFSKDKDMPGSSLAASGMACKGRYCEEGRLSFMGVRVDASRSSTGPKKSAWISDNKGKKWPWNDKSADDIVADCADGRVVSYMECRGKYCDDIRLSCSNPIDWRVDEIGQPWVADVFFSEEGDARQDCPAGFVIVGLECQKSKTWCVSKCHDYCDNKKLRCRQIIPTAIGAANLGIAESREIEVAEKASTVCDESCRAVQDSRDAIVGGAASTSLCGGVLALSVFFWYLSF